MGGSYRGFARVSYRVVLPTQGEGDVCQGPRVGGVVGCDPLWAVITHTSMTHTTI